MSVRRALVLSFAQRYLSASVYLLSTIILARLLTPAEIGIFSLCAAFVAVAAGLRDFGLSEYLIQERDLTEGKLRATYAVSMAIAWLVGGVLFASKGLIADAYGEQGLRSVIAVLSINFLVLPFATPAFALLNRDMAFGRILLIQLASTIAQAAVSIVLAWRGFGYMSLAWASVASTAVQVVGVALARPRESWLFPSFRGAGAVFRYGATYTATNLIDRVGGSFHEFVIGKQFGFDALGLFSRAQGLIDQFKTNVSQAIGRVFTPAFAAIHRSGASLADGYLSAVELFTVVAWPFFGYVAIMAPQIIRVVLGSQWVEAGPIARVMCVGGFPAALWVFVPNVMGATGQVERRFRMVMICMPIYMVLVWAAGYVDLIAVAWAGVLSTFIHLVVYVLNLKAVIGVGLFATMKSTRRSAIVAGATVAACLPFGNWTADTVGGSAAAIGVSSAAGGFAWLVTVLVTKHPIKDEILGLWNRARAGRVGQS